MSNTKQTTAVAQNDESFSQRFTNRVVTEFKATSQGIELSDKQKRLISNYFIGVDQALKLAEEKRLKVSEDRRESLAYTWANVQMDSLAIRVVAFSKLGLDPTQPNHLFPIPYKNNTTNKYDITMIMGYKGIEVKAMKYGLDIPKNMVVEVVFKNDDFKPLKKDRNNKIESYEFNIVNPWERGEIVGGFYYKEFEDPTKNKLEFMSIKEIEKRKPKYASAEFWGGEKAVYKNGSKTNETTKIEGWYYEMVRKTLDRAAYNSITIDADKIDDNYMAILNAEREATILEASQEIELNANSQELKITPHEEIKPNALPESNTIEIPTTKAEPATATSENGQVKAAF